jgi:hypothetical protein
VYDDQPMAISQGNQKNREEKGRDTTVSLSDFQKRYKDHERIEGDGEISSFVFPQSSVIPLSPN